MIVVRLSDGLGNQLFQYAAAETLRRRTGAKIGYLTDAFSSPRARHDRPLLLPQLAPVQDQILPPGSVAAARSLLLHRLLRPRGQAVRHIAGLCHITRRPAFDPRFSQIRDGMLVSGYFQSRQCVADILVDLRESLLGRFGRQLETARAELRGRFGERRKLALHLRLGDYRQIGDGSEALVPIARIRSVLQSAGRDVQILAFTDTPEALGALDLGRPVTLAGDGDTLMDFARMIACDDFVIANSTYSWWASALGQAPDKRIWAPRDWSRPARPGSDPQNDIYLPEHRLY